MNMSRISNTNTNIKEHCIIGTETVTVTETVTETGTRPDKETRTVILQ